MSRDDHAPEISLATITITGPDAVAFAQSQLTLDVEGIDDTLLHPAAWCRPDGRVDAVLLVAVGHRNVSLVLPRSLAESAFKRARMYSIGRKVEIAAGPAVRGGGPTASAGECALALSCDSGRALILAELDNPDAAESAAWSLPADWLHADVDCGMPWILPETAGMFLPQMLGLEALGGLSYRKGCFPGQEVIARVHYRGRLTRRLAGFRLRASQPPLPGTTFELADKPAVILYAVARSGSNDASDGLAVVSTDVEGGAEFHIAGAEGALVSR
ncbi:MAG: folate-binding protein YgfZ [Wenzhouxiangellaceae bacterium]|nr:folate-binding protein YgfZ [Wenzhouxiangellaceae bacterium]MBS3823421.1 folate-binding protein YgfZ [Wenzhouxiangellaceae bacterium]